MASELDTKNSIQNAMIVELRAALTIGRTDEKLEPFSNAEIDSFVVANQGELKNAVEDMYDTYLNDGELEDLKTAELDWYREFLYDHISWEKIMQNK
jgi:hypothetical protein